MDSLHGTTPPTVDPMGNVASVTVGFRPLQAAHDLVDLARKARSDTVLRLAKGVPSAELSAAEATHYLSAMILETHGRILADGQLKLHETLLLAATLPDDDYATFELASLLLLADRLQHGRGPDDLYWHWDAFAAHYQLAPPPVRAALINGFIECERMGRLPNGTVSVAPITGVDVGRVRSDLRAIVAEAGDDVLKSISQADYGDQAEAHLAELRRVITDQGCILRPVQSWVPTEVIELVANDPSHPGFSTATAILLVTAISRGDHKGWFDFRWEALGRHYGQLPPREAWAIQSAIRYLYETDPYFEAYPGAQFDPEEHRAHLIPLLTMDDRPLSPQA